MKRMRILLPVIALVLTTWLAYQTSAQAPTPVVATGVLMTLNKPGTIEVEISLGADDGLRAGHKLEVTHQGKMVGKLEVVKTKADRSTAKIVDVVGGGFLAERDEVSIKFSIK